MRRSRRAVTGAPTDLRIAMLSAGAAQAAVALPVRKALGDDLGRLHRRLAQVRVFGDLALNARPFLMQQFAQLLQLADQAVDLLHRRTGNALQQRADVMRDQFAVVLRRTAQGLSVTADELADLAFNAAVARRLF